MSSNQKKQWQRALELLREGPASALALWAECGIYRASDAIYTLREYGFEIKTEMVKFTTTRGYYVEFAKYTLISEKRARLPANQSSTSGAGSATR